MWKKCHLVFPTQKWSVTLLHCWSSSYQSPSVSAALRQIISDQSLVRTCSTFMDTATWYLPHRWGCLQNQRILELKGWICAFHVHDHYGTRGTSLHEIIQNHISIPCVSHYAITPINYFPTYISSPVALSHATCCCRSGLFALWVL